MANFIIGRIKYTEFWLFVKCRNYLTASIYTHSLNNRSLACVARRARYCFTKPVRPSVRHVVVVSKRMHNVVKLFPPWHGHHSSITPVFWPSAVTKFQGDPLRGY